MTEQKGFLGVANAFVLECSSEPVRGWVRNVQRHRPLRELGRLGPFFLTGLLGHGRRRVGPIVGGRMGGMRATASGLWRHDCRLLLSFLSEMQQ
eukprot:scaffold7155_cov119-Amphora_coffeaeformis.AAC.2